ncbi:MAG: DNA repair protein RecN [Candidatus Polarisedimenticolaceae bacterium]|nr:DNA repair protein RecN [Candidatus Polarisedimenticolaceae bacterium]
MSTPHANMLSHIQIKDLAIVASISMDLTRGMTALTGETGAGKSIFIDALGLALGDRTDNGMIRNGEARAEVTALFDTSYLPEVESWLRKHELDDDGECILRRVLVRDGRSRSFINGRPISIQLLQDLGQQLVDIHGQHAHQSLLRSAIQRQLLDAYGGFHALADEVSSLYRTYHTCHSHLHKLTESAKDHNARLDLLQFQANELIQLDLSLEELRSLDLELHRLSNLDQLQIGCGTLLNELYEGDNTVLNRLSDACAKLEQLQILDPALDEQQAYIENALIQIQEGASGLRDYMLSLESEPGALPRVEDRLEAIHDLARKYRIRADELPARLEEVHSELSALEQADSTLESLQLQLEEHRQNYLTEAGKLTKKRTKAAARLTHTVSDAMQKLGMEGGRFSVTLRPLAEGEITNSGSEQVEFLVSANPGQPEKPLSKVASGGELSRISLAIQVATAECAAIPTLVFDEVDVGIGGRVAEIVGQLLRQLGSSKQVLCVTHLAQVAAQANHHMKFAKSASRSGTVGGVTSLNNAQRTDEVARMLGGIEITAQTLAHAGEMLEKAAS